MMKEVKAKEWHAAKTGNHQGLIIDQDGRNVAVSYDVVDSPLIAAAPNLLEAMKKMIEAFTSGDSRHHAVRIEAIAAIAKAEGK